MDIISSHMIVSSVMETKHTVLPLPERAGSTASLTKATACLLSPPTSNPPRRQTLDRLANTRYRAETVLSPRVVPAPTDGPVRLSPLRTSSKAPTAVDSVA